MGVIFYANADTVLVVATKELGQYIYADSLGNISNVTNDAITLCGTENTAAILASDFYSPAALAASQYSSPIAGWSLPSAGELRRLSQHLGKVKDAMAVVGGDAFLHEQYLSSSQDGSTSETTQRLYYAVSLENGFVTSVDKMTARNVRPILRIK
ncbi:MAG: hypothetical protein PUG74_10495 [Prevotellaceae bacterium]|nr:hypothetical protein [Prevotellaceae bacterium]